MSVLWMDDPSFYTDTELTTRWSRTGGVPSVSAGTGRFGGPSWHVGGSGLGNLQANAGAHVVTGCAAFSYKSAGAFSGGTQVIFAFQDAGTTQCDLRISTGGNLFVTRNGTQIGSTSTNALSSNVWYRIEFKITIGSGTGGTIEVRVNGTSTNWIPSTGSLNTANTANIYFDHVAFGQLNSTTTPAVDFNDFVLTDNNSPNAGFLGDKRIFALYPNANSAVQWTNNWAAWAASTAYVLNQQIKDSNNNIQKCTTAGTSKSGLAPTWATTGGNTTADNTVTWTVVGSGANPGAANWMAVSEGIADGDNSYNSDSTPNDVDLFTIGALPAGASNISAVDNVLYCRKDDAGTRTISNEIKSGGTTSNAANLGLSTSYVFNDFINDQDPNAGPGAWTVANVNALLVGYKEIA